MIGIFKTSPLVSSLVMASSILAISIISTTSSAAVNSVLQSKEVIDFATGNATRGAATLKREMDQVSLSMSVMDLAENSAYSIWWVFFNEPQNCLEPFACAEGDVFEAPSDLNDTQVTAIKLSTIYAAGFVTGNDGVANITATLDSGNIPTGTFVDHGWSVPVDFGPDDNSGLLPNNGMGAEIHVILRSHGRAVAGSVGEQITTFNGLCDIQECSLAQAAIFPALELATPAYCVDEDGDGWGWDGVASCLVNEMNSADGKCIDHDGDGWGWDGTKACSI